MKIVHTSTTYKNKMETKRNRRGAAPQAAPESYIKVKF